MQPKQTAPQADILAQLAEQRRLLQISEWEYETQKQQLIDPQVPVRPSLKRDFIAALIFLGVVFVGVAGFTVAYPKEASMTATFLKSIFLSKPKTVFEQFQGFEDTNDSMVDGWFNPDQTTVGPAPKTTE